MKQLRNSKIVQFTVGLVLLPIVIIYLILIGNPISKWLIDKIVKVGKVILNG